MDQVQTYGQVGSQNYPVGIQAILRLGNQADLIVSELHGRYYEQTYRTNTFSQDSGSITITSAFATKSALGTAKFVNGFYNPATSGKNAVILLVQMGTVSGTPAGPFFYNYISDTTINSAATGTISSNVVGGLVASLMVAQTNIALANVAGGTTALKQFGIMGGPAAVAAGAGLYVDKDQVDGRIIVPPGTLFGLVALTTGTTHIVQSTMTWEEVPV